MLQTFFLNMFFAGKLKSMPPKLVSDDGKHIVIRPLAYVAEKDLVRWAQHREFPIIPCTLCGSQENLQRKQVGEMLREWEKKHPGRVENMFTALQNVVPSHLLDGTRHDFKGLKATGVADDDGDKAFDTPSFDLLSQAPAALRIVQGLIRLPRGILGIAARRPFMKRASLALLLVAAATVTLSGCATSWVVDSDVKSFSSLSTVPPGATYRFERLPSQQADTARQDSLEAMAAAALEKVGPPPR
jgi:predicted small secreted protein